MADAILFKCKKKIVIMNCKVIHYLDANALFKLVNVFDRRVCGIKMPFYDPNFTYSKVLF